MNRLDDPVFYLLHGGLIYALFNSVCFFQHYSNINYLNTKYGFCFAAVLVKADHGLFFLLPAVMFSINSPHSLILLHFSIESRYFSPSFFLARSIKSKFIQARHQLLNEWHLDLVWLFIQALMGMGAVMIHPSQYLRTQLVSTVTHF